MFAPKYSITDQLLANITQINVVVNRLNNRRFPKLILMEYEKSAREISVYSSTSIEGNPLPLTEVKKVLKLQPSQLRDSEREVINYNAALEWLNIQASSKTLAVSITLIKSIHKRVMANILAKYETGEFRKKPVVVNDPRTGQVVFLPPDWQTVHSLMNELVTFLKQNQSMINPLILAGLFHKQLVLIHPFMDGNGRTTRLATKVLLAKMGLNTFNLFSFENYYNLNVTNYFQMVGEFGDYNEIAHNMDFTPWLEYFTAGLIDELLRVEKLLPELDNSPASRLENYHLKIIEYIKKNGVITDREYAKLTKRAKPTRTLDFKKMLEMELIERKGGGRSTYYVLKAM